MTFAVNVLIIDFQFVFRYHGEVQKRISKARDLCLI